MFPPMHRAYTESCAGGDIRCAGEAAGVAAESRGHCVGEGGQDALVPRRGACARACVAVCGVWVWMSCVVFIWKVLYWRGMCESVSREVAAECVRHCVGDGGHDALVPWRGVCARVCVCACVFVDGCVRLCGFVCCVAFICARLCICGRCVSVLSVAGVAAECGGHCVGEG